jgi:hypothetical protein
MSRDPLSVGELLTIAENRQRLWIDEGTEKRSNDSGVLELNRWDTETAETQGFGGSVMA